MSERGIGPAPPAAAASATGLAPSSSSATAPSSPQPEAEAARSVLADLQRTLRDGSGRPRTGLLRLRREAGKPGDAMPRLEHQSSFHLNRVSRSQVQDTARALRRVFAEAGLPPQAQQQLEHYLHENGERAQVARIVELIDQHLPKVSGREDPVEGNP